MLQKVIFLAAGFLISWLNDGLCQVAVEVLKMTISLSPDEIVNLARQINETIESLTNIDAILDETRNDLRTVTELKKKADDTKYVCIGHFSEHFTDTVSI